MTGDFKITKDYLKQLNPCAAGYKDFLTEYPADKYPDGVGYQAILDKYASNNPAGTGQAYNLPGVFNTSLAAYDVNAAKADNQRVVDLLPMIDEAEQQKNYYYDSLVGKLIVHGRNRDECLMRLRRSLDEFVVDGVDTTLPLFRTLVRNPDILNGDYNIHWLEKFLAAGGMGEPEA